MTRTGVVAAMTAVEPSWLFMSRDVGSDGVAADLDVVRERGEHPDATATVEAAGGLEVQARSKELVDEPESLLVLDDPIVGSCR
jgi:hypothetical protein